MQTIQALLTHGIGLRNATLLAIRVGVGGFFAVSGAHKLFNPARRQSLRETFAADGVRFAPMMYVVPGGELLGGLGVLAGALTVLAALGLAALCVGACALDGLKRIPAMHPVDLADRASDILYLPEVLYVLCLLAVVSFGPGAYSLDALVLG